MGRCPALMDHHTITEILFFFLCQGTKWFSWNCIQMICPVSQQKRSWQNLWYRIRNLDFNVVLLLVILHHMEDTVLLLFVFSQINESLFHGSVFQYIIPNVYSTCSKLAQANRSSRTHWAESLLSGSLFWCYEPSEMWNMPSSPLRFDGAAQPGLHQRVTLTAFFRDSRL